jgi:hypothetical protein
MDTDAPTPNKGQIAVATHTGCRQPFQIFSRKLMKIESAGLKREIAWRLRGIALHC